jgi:hypothetical protein
VGGLLRDWRRRRRLSQLDLGIEAGVSARHLSFVETGRSKPSRALLHLGGESCGWVSPNSASATAGPRRS